MPCPFPGMDPYLEKYQYWADFTPKLLVAISNALNPRLLPRNEALYVIVTHEDIRLHRVKPDVTISSTPQWTPETITGTAVADPTIVELEYPDLEPITQRVLKVIQRSNRQVVTVIEVLSPGNKEPGENGIETYLSKRAEYLSSGCHLVEIDLLRGGERLPMRQPLPAGDYYVFIGRRGSRPRGQVIGWNWKSHLPTISLPLLPDDPEIALDLQSVFQSAYEPACYDRMLPYNESADPPLSPADESWARERLHHSERST